MAAASATSTLFKPLSMAEGCLFTAKSSYPFLALPPKPVKVTHLSSSASSPSWVSLRNKFSSSNLIPLVASTSDWAGEESQVKEDEFKWDGDSLEGAVDSGDEEGGVVESGSEDEESGGFFEHSGGYPEPPEEAKLFVGNLPYDTDSEKLAQLFEQSGTVEIAEVIYNRETDQSRGFGFVTMSTVEEAEKAVEAFHQYDINGRLLTVNKAAPRGSRPERAPRSFGPSLRLYVGNLPWQVDDSQLKQVFSEHGQVIDARVVFDRETGRSRGFGFVTMASQTELDDAIAAMDGQSLDGRPIRVNVAEERPRRAF